MLYKTDMGNYTYIRDTRRYLIVISFFIYSIVILLEMQLFFEDKKKRVYNDTFQYEKLHISIWMLNNNEIYFVCFSSFFQLRRVYN